MVFVYSMRVSRRSGVGVMPADGQAATTPEPPPEPGLLVEPAPPELALLPLPPPELLVEPEPPLPCPPEPKPFDLPPLPAPGELPAVPVQPAAAIATASPSAGTRQRGLNLLWTLIGSMAAHCAHDRPDRSKIS